MMWKEFTADGLLRYPNFLETVTQIMPMYILRAVGGTLYIVGALFAVVNLWKTAKSGKLIATEEDQAPAMDKSAEVRPSVTKRAFHRWFEGKPALFTVLVVVAILIGGIVEFIPTAMVDSNVPKIDSVKPYTPLELAGRDIYISDGCNNCHSQMIRPFRSETARYGDYSKAGEFVYDHPFLWGSKRTGPDLHRIGGKYPDSWHYLHMRDPQSTSPGSIMPASPWMYTRDTDFDILPAKIRALQILNVPYAYAKEDPAIIHDAKVQAEQIAAALRAQGFSDADANKQIIALIAYMQRMGTDIKNASVVPLK
jgi:cytochrome c oxidase cbb3-type subunit I/II